MTYTVGIIGTGFGSRVHLPALQEHPAFDVKIIAGRNEENTKNIAERAGIAYTTNWKDIITSDVDIVAVTTPPYHHYRMAKKTLKAGKHLLLEKPTTGDAREAKKLLELAQDSHLVAMMCHEFRWVPLRNFFTDLVRSGRLGNIREIHTTSFSGGSASGQQPSYKWLWDAAYDGGMFGAMGSHLIDQIRTTTGLEFKSVQGQLYTRLPERMGNDGLMHRVTADDSFSMAFELETGVTGTINMTTSTSPAPPSYFIVSGTKGTAYYTGNEVYYGEIGGEFTKLDIPQEFQIDESLAEKDRRIPPFMKLLDQFEKSLAEGVSKTPSILDGWKNQVVVDAVRLSDKTGQRIKINYY